MVEVTDEMVDAAAQAFTTKPTEATYVVARRMIEAALKVHEANRPKPDPVGYIYPSSYAKALRNKSSCKMFVVPVTNLDTGEESSLPLYTTPPTREPLSDDQINYLIDMMETSCGERLVDFARAIEQAHGIGSTK